MADERESGYSLIELMVVVAIIGVVMAAAMPTFSGATRRTHDRSAQTALRQAMSAAKTLDLDPNGWFAAGSSCMAAPLDAADLQAAEPPLTFEQGPDAPSRYGGVAVFNNSSCSRLRLVTRAAADRFYGVEMAPNGSTGFCSGTRIEVARPAPCDGTGW